MIEIIKKMLNQAGKYKGKYIRGLIYNTLKSLFISVMLLALFYIFANLEHLTMRHIWISLGILLFSVIGRFIFQYLTDVTLGEASYDTYRDKRMEYGNLLKRAPMGFFNESNLGTIQSTLINTVSDVESRSTMTLTFLVGGMVQAVFMSLILFAFSPVMGCISLAAIALGQIAIRIIRKLVIQYHALSLESTEELVSSALEYIQGISVTRLFSKGFEADARLNKAMENKREVETMIANKTDWIMKVYEGIYKVAACALLLTSVILYLNHTISISYALMFMACSFLVYSELEMMGNGAYLSHQLDMQLTRLKKVFDIPQMDENGEDVTLTNRTIEFRDVNFSYGDGDVLKNINLTIPEGSKCAVIGPSGSGKTTLCRLISRFWDPTKGQVLMGGQDISRMSLHSVFENISIVFQNVYLFADTIENNIRFGRPDATPDMVKEAARRAMCHDFIESLPQGYQTVIGEGGATLSGGEKQRISIARAILKNAPIIILDEATASIDPENEHLLLGALEELTKEKTIISIAHRLYTVKNADQIVVLEHGTIVQKGTHEELLAQGGLYQHYIGLRQQSQNWRVKPAHE